jgi:hypothetical protein
MPSQERVPDGIEKVFADNHNINIGRISKPTGKVVRAEAESDLRTSDDHNILFIDAQGLRNVGSEVNQCAGLPPKGIRITRENAILQHLINGTVKQREFEFGNSRRSQ